MMPFTYRPGDSDMPHPSPPDSLNTSSAASEHEDQDLVKMITTMNQTRTQRLFDTLSNIDHIIASRVVSPTPTTKSSQLQQQPLGPDGAALRLQCWIRRIHALRLYRQKLYDHFLEEDRKYQEKQALLVDDTMAMLDAMKAQQDLLHRRWIDHANKQYKRRQAYKIQKWFRRRSMSTGSQEGGNDDEEKEEEEGGSTAEQRPEEEEEAAVAVAASTTPLPSPPPPLPPPSSAMSPSSPHTLEKMSTTATSKKKKRQLTLEVPVEEEEEDIYNIVITPPTKSKGGAAAVSWSATTIMGKEREGQGGKPGVVSGEGNDIYDVLFTPKVVRQAFGDFEEEEEGSVGGESIYDVSVGDEEEASDDDDEEEEAYQDRLVLDKKAGGEEGKRGHQQQQQKKGKEKEELLPPVPLRPASS